MLAAAQAVPTDDSKSFAEQNNLASAVVSAATDFLNNAELTWCKSLYRSTHFVAAGTPQFVNTYDPASGFYKDYLVIRNAQQQACPVPMRHVAGTRA